MGFLEGFLKMRNFFKALISARLAWPTLAHPSQTSTNTGHRKATPTTQKSESSTAPVKIPGSRTKQGGLGNHNYLSTLTQIVDNIRPILIDHACDPGATDAGGHAASLCFMPAAWAQLHGAIEGTVDDALSTTSSGFMPPAWAELHEAPDSTVDSHPSHANDLQQPEFPRVPVVCSGPKPLGGEGQLSKLFRAEREQRERLRRVLLETPRCSASDSESDDDEPEADWVLVHSG
ncbi:hypothetical protein GGR56DRAFT_619768 [Xylariaceae sp. FL0804]|nr:hypothetical protein GGR56DRAFT_619768 [Xylariaceae sp. FL0804]